MAGDDDDSDKSHEASQHKLDEARKKGEIARSADLLTAVAYLGLLIVFLALGPDTLIRFGNAMMPLIDQPERMAPLFFTGPAIAPTGELMRQAIMPILPWLLFPAAIVILSLIAQRGLVFTPSKLKPKMSRLSLIENAKNKYGRRGLFEFAKSFVKLTVYSISLAVFLMAELETIVGSLQGGPGAVLQILGALLIKLMTLVVIIAAMIGLIDVFWQQQEHLRKNKMSHKEMRDEYKESEGDPHMKQQRRARAQEIAMNQMMLDVPKADVVIVNPTHYAVALTWSRKPGEAPVCIAKGVDGVAARIREVATRENIPIHSDPPTARALHATVEIGAQIDQEHYRPVAAAIRFSEDMRRKARGRGRK